MCMEASAGPSHYNLNTVSLRLTARLCHDYIERHLLSNSAASTKRLVIVMKRRTRSLVNHKETLSIIRKFASETRRHVYIYDDKALPSLNETMTLFYRADVIFGPHGAGFANMIFARPGTFVADVQCRGTDNIRVCYRQLALKLGMRYFGTVTTRNSTLSKRCNKEGVLVDIEEVKELFSHLTSVYRAYHYGSRPQP